MPSNLAKFRQGGFLPRRPHEPAGKGQPAADHDINSGLKQGVERQRADDTAERGHDHNQRPVLDGKKPPQAGPRRLVADMRHDFGRDAIKNKPALHKPQPQPRQNRNQDQNPRSLVRNPHPLPRQKSTNNGPDKGRAEQSRARVGAGGEAVETLRQHHVGSFRAG